MPTAVACSRTHTIDTGNLPINLNTSRGQGMKRAHHDIICSTLIAVDAVQVESRGRTPAELEGLLLLPPQPQLRNLFPGPALPNPVCEAPGSGGVFNRNSSNQRGSFTGGRGGSMPMGGAGGPAAAKAWAKLMLVHERQQREQRWGTQQQADSDSISTSL